MNIDNIQWTYLAFTSIYTTYLLSPVEVEGVGGQRWQVQNGPAFFGMPKNSEMHRLYNSACVLSIFLEQSGIKVVEGSGSLALIKERGGKSVEPKKQCWWVHGQVLTIVISAFWCCVILSLQQNGENYEKFLVHQILAPCAMESWKSQSVATFENQISRLGGEYLFLRWLQKRAEQCQSKTGANEVGVNRKNVPYTYKK